MKELIIHIGRGKCGSSSLQRFLCKNFANRSLDYDFIYCACTEDGIMTGARLLSATDNTPLAYVSSTPRLSIKHATWLNNKFNKNETVIISNEGLWYKAEKNIIDFINHIEAPIRIFFLTRPDVEFFNSAWWQWGIFKYNDVEEWFENSFDRYHTNLSLSQTWQGFDGVMEFKTYDLSYGPVDAFLDFINLKAFKHTDTFYNNVSSDPNLLRILVKNKYIGRGINKPYIEFLLNNLINYSGKSPPFVLSKKMIDRILDRCVPDNIKFLRHIKFNNCAANKADKYIQGDTFYKNISNFDMKSFLDEGYSEEFVFELVETILRINNER